MKNVDKTGQYCPLKRAERISKMSNPTEVLWQFEDMSEGGDGGNDFYTYSIIKTASATYTVLANVANFA